MKNSKTPKSNKKCSEELFKRADSLFGDVATLFEEKLKQDAELHALEISAFILGEQKSYGDKQTFFLAAALQDSAKLMSRLDEYRWAVEDDERLE